MPTSPAFKLPRTDRSWHDVRQSSQQSQTMDYKMTEEAARAEQPRSTIVEATALKRNNNGTLELSAPSTSAEANVSRSGSETCSTAALAID